MPVLREWRLLALAGFSFGLARLSGGDLPHFIFYSSLVLLALSWTWAWYVARCVRCTIDLAPLRLQVGSSLQVHVTVQNSGWASVPWAEIRCEPTATAFAAAAPHQAMSLRRRQGRELSVQLLAWRRGRHAAGRVTVELGDGLGIFRVRRTLVVPGPVTIYPRVPRRADPGLVARAAAGGRRGGGLGPLDPTALAGLRLYQPGDNPRHIHWRTSARRGELHLKQFENRPVAQVALVLDLSAPGYAGPGGEEALEAAVEHVAGLAALCAGRGLAVGFWAWGARPHIVPLGQQSTALAAILEALVDVSVTATAPFADVLRSHWRGLPAAATLAVVTPAISPALVSTLMLMADAHSVMLFQVPRHDGTAANRGAVDLLARRGIAVRPVPARVAAPSPPTSTPGEGRWPA